MLCDICHKNIATVHLTEIVNSKTMEMHICSRCAKLKAKKFKDVSGISDFLSGLIGEKEIKEEKEVSLRCSFCGLTYQNFKRKGRLGCKSCYITFKHQLLPLVKKIHGSNQHTGKYPLPLEEGAVKETKLKILEERLKRAIQLEEYEEAAFLRDEIKKYHV